jgi:hypothetical protein
MLICQFLRCPPSTHFMELKVIMHHRIGRPNADIQLFCRFVNNHSSVLKKQFPTSSFILCGCGCGWTTRALCVSHTRMATLKLFNPLIHDSTGESTDPILSTHDEFVHLVHLLPTKNVSQVAAPPLRNCQVSLPCSPLHSSSHTNCKVNRLALPTSHMTPHNTHPHPSRSFHFL